MSKEYNHKHVTLTCPECKHTEIRIDPVHQETYCTTCGLILSDNAIFSIVNYIEKEQTKNLQLNKLWKSVKNKNIFTYGPR